MNFGNSVVASRRGATQKVSVGASFRGPTRGYDPRMQRGPSVGGPTGGGGGRQYDPRAVALVHQMIQQGKIPAPPGYRPPASGPGVGADVGNGCGPTQSRWSGVFWGNPWCPQYAENCIEQTPINAAPAAGASRVMATGTTQTFTFTVTEPFAMNCLLIAPSIADLFEVTSLQLGRCNLLDSGSAVPGEAFLQDAVCCRLVACRTIWPSVPLSITVTNISGGDARFNATVYGEYLNCQGAPGTPPFGPNTPFGPNNPGSIIP